MILLHQKALINASELQDLLQALLHTDTCIRFRLLGELWRDEFLSVIHVSQNGAMFVDGKGHVYSVNDLSFMMQIELDKPFKGFQPLFHYEVSPLEG